MILDSWLPQLGDVPVRLGRALSKAAKGSIKSVDWLRNALEFLAVAEIGPEAWIGEAPWKAALAERWPARVPEELAEPPLSDRSFLALALAAMRRKWEGPALLDECERWAWPSDLPFGRPAVGVAVALLTTAVLIAGPTPARAREHLSAYLDLEFGGDVGARHLLPVSLARIGWGDALPASERDGREAERTR